jgi:hypothetical protein
MEIHTRIGAFLSFYLYREFEILEIGFGYRPGIKQVRSRPVAYDGTIDDFERASFSFAFQSCSETPSKSGSHRGG